MLPRILVALVLLPCAALPCAAQPRPPEIHNRVGAISDDVALQRLRLEGVEDPRIERREGQQIFLRGMVGGRETTLRMDALRGATTDTAGAQPVLIAPGMAARPVVTGPRLVQPRSTLADPALMRDAIKPGP